jgi:hypothetical protein
MDRSLSDKLNPDTWMKAGRMLLDYPVPSTTESRKFASMVLSDDPELLARFSRWLSRIDQFGAASKRFGNDRTEAALRMMWEEAGSPIPKATADHE